MDLCRSMLLLMAVIFWRRACGSDNVRTLPAISGVSGSTIELPCEIHEPVAVVTWYRYSFLGDTAAENAKSLVYTIGSEVTNEAGPRFSMTPTYSLAVKDLSVEDENTYSCYVALEVGGGYASYINLTVIALAQPLHPTVDYCTPTREGVCIYTVAESIEDSETFAIICRVNMVRPAVRLSWNITEGGTNLTEEKQVEGGLWNVSLSIKVSKYEVGDKLTCLAAGSAVNGSSQITAFIEHYHQGTPESITVEATAPVSQKPLVKDWTPFLVSVASIIVTITVLLITILVAIRHHIRKEFLRRFRELEDRLDREHGFIVATSGTTIRNNRMK
ncbi:uncharacterized protein [Diadema antillarum]|uniref:uncharacterized protein n=1 Tax=Diadema antillarum TaxID=105358 RepID=UPI003A852922